MPIPSWVTMIATVLLQLVILLIAAGIIILIRQHFRFFKRLHVVPVDVWPPFLLLVETSAGRRLINSTSCHYLADCRTDCAGVANFYGSEDDLSALPGVVLAVE